MQSWSGILVFAEAAETLSFVAAGRRLGISPSAVGKAVAKLEAQFGVRLMHRSTRSLRLTEEGARFHTRCRRALDELGDAQAALSAAALRPRGRLRLSLPTVGYHFLLPHLDAFHGAYPEIVLDLDFSDRLVDVIADGFDAVVRSGKLADSRLLSRRLGGFRFVVVAAPAYLERHRPPRAPAELSRHRRLLFRSPASGKIQPWALRGARLDGEDGGVLVANNMEAVLGAAVDGLGVAYMPDFLAAPALDAGRLRLVLARHPSPPGAFHLLWPRATRPIARLRAFIDFVAPRLFPARR